MAAAQQTHQAQQDAPDAQVVGVILAGGRSRRMGGRPKSLAPLAGRPLLAHVIARLRPQLRCLVLNVNAPPAPFTAFGLPITADSFPGFAGPLAGILAGMAWARQHEPQARHIITAATDTPFFPRDLVARLCASADAQATKIVLATSAGRVHPVFGLWPTALAPKLRSALKKGERRVWRWAEAQGAVLCPFPPDPTIAPLDPFFNINTPADLRKAENILMS